MTVLAVLLGACAAPTCGTRPSTSAAPSASPAAASSPAGSGSPPPAASAAPLVIAPATFHPGEVGAAYGAIALSATGGAPPYAWSLGSGALPDGLMLGADGSVSGSPVTSGHFAFGIQAADSGGGTATLAGSIDVAAALSASLLPGCARACQVEAGCADVCGDFGTLSGGTAPFTFTANGYVPPGVHLGSGLAYVGTFSRPVSYWQSTVTVTDSFGETASVSPIFNVFPHIALASGACEAVFTPCSLQLKITGGAPGATPTVALAAVAPNPNRGCWSPTATAPPTGYTVAVSKGYISVFVPRPSSGYGAVWTLVVTDGTRCSASSNCASPPATATIGIECT